MGTLSLNLLCITFQKVKIVHAISQIKLMYAFVEQIKIDLS